MNLLGTWQVDPADIDAVNTFGNVFLHFKANGELLYVVRGETSNQLIRLLYEVRGEFIVTTQPSAPRIERTRFQLLGEDLLDITFDGVTYRFCRAANCPDLYRLLADSPEL